MSHFFLADRGGGLKSTSLSSSSSERIRFGFCRPEFFFVCGVWVSIRCVADVLVFKTEALCDFYIGERTIYCYFPCMFVVNKLHSQFAKMSVNNGFETLSYVKLNKRRNNFEMECLYFYLVTELSLNRVFFHNLSFSLFQQHNDNSLISTNISYFL